jgi:hypothetical protein
MDWEEAIKKGKLEANKWVISSSKSQDWQYNNKKDKQWSTKHYTENNFWSPVYNE